MCTSVVIRCRFCRLNQFETASGCCRRCRKPLRPEAVNAHTPEAQLGRPSRYGVDVGFAIWMVRSALQLTQRHLADSMGVPRSYISKLERNRAIPTIRQLSRIAEALGVTEYSLVAFAAAAAHHARRSSAAA